MNAGLSARAQVVVRMLMPTMLGLDEALDGEPARIDHAVQRLSAFFASLDRPDTSAPHVTQLGLLLDAMYRLYELEYLQKPEHFSVERQREVVGALFEPEHDLLGEALQWVKVHLGDPIFTQRDLARAIREMISLAYYSDPRNYDVTGYTAIWNRPEILREAPELRAPASDLDPAAIAASHRVGADRPSAQIFANDGRPRVAVIGSGAGGAVLAAALAATKKYDVAVLEAGPRFAPHEYPLDTMSAMSLLFEDGIQTVTKNLDVQLLRGRAFGGSTILTSGMTIRPRPATLADWQTRGLDLPAMNAALDGVQRRLRIETIEHDLVCDPGERWRRGGEALAEQIMFQVPQALVATRAAQHVGNPNPNPDKRGERCLGCGMCNYGCHFGHKLSMDLTYLLDAERDGARVHQNLAVDRLVSTLDDDGVARVRALALRRDADANIDVDYVVLAAGAVGSAALLLRSLEQASMAWLPARAHFGAGLGFNYGATAIARFADVPARPGDAGIQISYVATKPTDERFVLESAFVPPGLMSTLVPGVGPDHRRFMRDYRKLGMCVNTIGSPQTGSVDRDGNVSYLLGEDELGVIHRTLALIVRMYLRGGAVEVGLSGVRTDDDAAARFHPGDERDPETLYDRLRTVAPDADYLMLASAHPQGGLRLGKSDADGAVGPDFRVHGVANLFTADASLFPSTIVVNPQWTVMALAQVASASVMSTIERERR